MRQICQGLTALSLLCGFLAIPEIGFGRDVVVSSPDRRVRAVLRATDGVGAITYSIQRDGSLLVEPSRLAVRLKGHGQISDGATVERVSERTIDETNKLLWGKSSRIRDRCNVASIRLESNGGIEWDLELRAYDDGVALRYGFSNQDQLAKFVIEDEATEFRFAGTPTLLYMPLKNFTTSHEALYERKPLADISAKQLLAVPLLAVWDDGRAAAITEARLRNFAGMYLEKTSAGSGIVRTRLSPLPANNSAVVETNTPCWSPWRVVLLADQAGELIESNLQLCLNDPPEGDFEWLEPGKTTWPWWNGEVEHGAPSTPESNFAIHKCYIDFCAKHKIRYHAISSVAGNYPWYVQHEPGFGRAWPDSDVLTARSDLDLPRIMKYAKSNGVDIRLWVHWKSLSEKLDEAFAAYERWGVKGLMIDFMDRDDQQMVEWQERALRAAAKHKLHIQFHGSYKPTGEQRTFPNLFNREGVLNLEYLKWSDACAPPHNVNVAYTRLLAGQVDFHLGGFRAASRDQFQSRDLMPLVLGSRCHQLALYVVYENPMPMVADTPESYENQPGFGFVVEVPTTWDETQFVAGEAGEYIVVARRRGQYWYLGGITNWSPRQLTLPLTFLGEGSFEAQLYLDGSLDGDGPNEIRHETLKLSGREVLDVSLAPGGGVAAVIRTQ